MSQLSKLVIAAGSMIFAASSIAVTPITGSLGVSRTSLDSSTGSQPSLDRTENNIGGYIAFKAAKDVYIDANLNLSDGERGFNQFVDQDIESDSIGVGIMMNDSKSFALGLRLSQVDTESQVGVSVPQKSDYDVVELHGSIYLDKFNFNVAHNQYDPDVATASKESAGVFGVQFFANSSIALAAEHGFSGIEDAIALGAVYKVASLPLTLNLSLVDLDNSDGINFGVNYVITDQKSLKSISRKGLKWSSTLINTVDISRLQ